MVPGTVVAGEMERSTDTEPAISGALPVVLEKFTVGPQVMV